VATRILKHLGLLATAAALVAYLWINVAGLGGPPIRSDGYSYYVYLPSWFLYHDTTLGSVAEDCCGGTFPAFTSIVRWPETGRWVNPHPIGVAVMTAPFFGAAHLLTRWSNLPPDGFSLYYQHGAGLAGLSLFVAGLLLLRSLLSRYFGDGVVLATLTTIALGTNLFHYATYDSTFSHAFSFCLIAALLDVTDRWWKEPSWTTTVSLALVAALIFLTRHPNVIYLFIVPLWNPAGLWPRRNSLLAIAVIAAAAIAPQLLIYKQATGHWWVSVYDQLGRFDLRAPHVWDVLFGVRKGLFFWSPVLLLAAAGVLVDYPGVPPPASHALVRRVRGAAIVVFALNTYLIASWSDWQLGGSFGHRGYTDGLALAAIFLAGFFDWIARKRMALWPTTVVTASLVALSCAQMAQYWIGVLPIADTSWAQYRELFLRFR
jgi:hypothetical protein